MVLYTSLFSVLSNNWFLVSEPGKYGVGILFLMFWYGTEYSEESGPETDISGRDLDFGRGVDGRSFEICFQKRVKV